MAQFNTPSTLDGLFKQIYNDSIKNLIPENTVLLKSIPFKSAEKTGDSFIVPVLLAGEQGFTYMASGDGVGTLKDSVAGTMKKASVNGAQLFLRSSIDMESVKKAQSDKEAFRNATELLVENMMDSASKRLEIMFMYGGTGLGTVSSLASQVITLTAASWAPGIWLGMEGALIDVYTSGGSVRQAGLVISSVDLDNKTITVTGTTTGIVSTDVIYFAGAYGKEAAGIDQIITNTGSLFGISAASYALWKGNSHSAGSAALTMSKVLSAVGKAIAKGGLNEDVVLLVSPATYSNLNADQAALRQYSDNAPEAKNGFNSIVYRGPNGKIEVVCSSVVKEGEAFILPLKQFKRVGASDLTFEKPNSKDVFFIDVPDKNAYEIRLYASQAIVCMAPAKCCKITSIVNS